MYASLTSWDAAFHEKWSPKSAIFDDSKSLRSLLYEELPAVLKGMLVSSR